MTEQKLSDTQTGPGRDRTAEPAPSGLGGPAGPAVPGPEAIAALSPLGVDQVRLHPEGLLGGWRRRNAEDTLPHCVDNLRGSGNIGNLQAAAGEGEQPFRGMWFADSDVHKTLEAALWELGTSPGDASLEAFVEDTVALLARAQQPDGYLNSYFTVAAPEERWRRPDWAHELYCAGHLIQAAVAGGRVGAQPVLLSVARRFADLLVERFGPDGVEEVCGHPEIETALAELYRLTGHRPYLDLARRFLDLRGHGLLGRGRFGPRYHQDHQPVREVREVAGHAVRQLYLLAGMVDVAVETGDLPLLDAAERLWSDAFHTRTYVTGAHGSRHRDEAYGDPYELPPDRAYAETCAAIASFQWNWRLLLATGRARYADEMERAVYNAVAAAVSADGRRFFYSNPLHLRTGHVGSGEEEAARRLPWYSCACCPPNIARLMASLPGYLATADEGGLQVHLYGEATLTAAVAGRPVRLEMRTDYPWQGRVELTVGGEAGRSEPWTLALRVPSWCEAYSVTIGDETVRAPSPDGYVRLTRVWTPGTKVVLDLDMPVRQVGAHPRVDAVRGCVTLARGPLVYCLEQADLPPGVVLEDVRLDPAAPVTAARRDDLPGAPVVLSARGVLADAPDRLDTTADAPGPLYTSGASRERTNTPLTLTAVPYFLWGNRTEGPMRVWIPLATTG